MAQAELAFEGSRRSLRYLALSRAHRARRHRTPMRGSRCAAGGVLGGAEKHGCRFRPPICRWPPTCRRRTGLRAACRRGLLCFPSREPGAQAWRLEIVETPDPVRFSAHVRGKRGHVCFQLSPQPVTLALVRKAGGGRQPNVAPRTGRSNCNLTATGFLNEGKKHIIFLSAFTRGHRCRGVVYHAAISVRRARATEFLRDLGHDQTRLRKEEASFSPSCR